MRPVTPDMKARSDARLAQQAKGSTRGTTGGQFGQQFDHRGAENAKAAKAEIDARRLRVKAEREAARKAKAAATKKAAKTATKTGIKAGLGKTAATIGKAVTRPIAAKVGLGAVARGGAHLVTKALGPVGWAATGAAYAGDSVKDTDTAQALQRPVTDAISKWFGNGDLQDRMNSNDPEVYKAAVAEYRASQAQQAGPEGQGPAATAQPTAAADTPAPDEGGQVPTEDPEAAIERPVAGSDEGAIDMHLLANSSPTNPALNAGNTQPIEGTNSEYAGKYGDNEVIKRPTIGKDGQPVIDPGTGEAVPEFTDNYTAFNRQRPGAGQGSAPQQSEEARVANARAQYIANTTGSDGRRHFGGSANERLNEARQEAIDRGDTESVGRQLDEETAKAQQQATVDAQNRGATPATQLAAFKHAYDRDRDAKGDARTDRTNAMKEAATMLAAYKDTAPEAYAQLYAMASDRYDGTTPMPQVIQSIMGSLDMESGGPEMDENHQLKMKMRDIAGIENAVPELDPYLQ